MTDNTDIEATDALHSPDDETVAEEAFFAWVEKQPLATGESMVTVHAAVDGMLWHLGRLERDLDHRRTVAAAHVEAARCSCRDRETY